MSAVGKELAESSAGRNSDSEGFAGEFSKLLIRKEKKDDAAAGDNNKKKFVEGGLSGDSDLCKSGEKLNKEAFGEGGGIIGFDSDLFFRTLEELVERSKKKTDDPPPGDERNHIKAMQLLKDINHNINNNLLKMVELSIIMSAVGKELAESSAGLLGRKEKKDDAAAGDNNKKKLVEGGLSGDSDLCKSGEKLNKEAFGEGGGIIGFDSDLFFRTLTDDPPPGDERNHIKAMQLLKEMHEKVKMEKKFLAQEQEKQGGGVNIVKNTNKKKKDDAAVVPATIGKKPLLLNDLLASRRASAPCPKVPMSKKQKTKASLEEFRRQFGPHRTTLTTARNMFLQDVAWSKDIIHRA